MSNNLIEQKIRETQNEYLRLLEKNYPYLESNDFPTIIDEINVFWKSKVRIIKLFLTYVSVNYDTYVFTGASYLDINDNENYPFYLMGKNHIVDDPLCKFAQVVVGNIDYPGADSLKQQIILAADDNIKILSKYNSYILVLPIRLLSELDGNHISKKANDVFFSMFNSEIVSLDYYISKYKSIDDVIKDLKLGIDKMLIFDEYEDKDIPFKDRFTNSCGDLQLPSGIPNTDANKLWFYLLGYIIQSLDILMMCAEYGLVPYLRSNVSFHYFLLISHNFKEDPELCKIIFKGVIAHLLYFEFNKKRISNITFEDYCRVLDEKKIYERLLETQTIEQITFENLRLAERRKIISEFLKNMYVELEQMLLKQI